MILSLMAQTSKIVMQQRRFQTLSGSHAWPLFPRPLRGSKHGLMTGGKNPVTMQRYLTSMKVKGAAEGADALRPDYGGLPPSGRDAGGRDDGGDGDDGNAAAALLAGKSLETLPSGVWLRFLSTVFPMPS